MRKQRTLALSAVTLLTAATFGLLAFSSAEYRVNLSSVLEIWGDLVRDVDQVGLTVTRVSDEKEMEIGRGIAAQIAYLVVTDHRSRYVAEVGQRMVPYIQRKRIQYQFHVLSSPDINAHALPGGQIYVTTAMLEFVENEAELAAVIGHEIAHVDLRHCIERLQYEHAARKVVGKDIASLVRLGHQLFVLGFSEQQELEADATGLLLAAEAGYDPAAAVTFNTRMATHSGRPERDKTRTMTGEAGRAIVDLLVEYFQTHPYGETRVHSLITAYNKNANVWRGKRFYVGRSNLAEFQSRSTSERDREWVDFRMSVDRTGTVETRAERSDPIATLENATDKDVCKGVLYGNPEFIREAARRGLSESECRALLVVPSETVTAPSDQVELLDRMRIKQSTSVYAAPSEDAARLGYIGGVVTVTGRYPETGWHQIFWTDEILGYIRSETLE